MGILALVMWPLYVVTLLQKVLQEHAVMKVMSPALLHTAPPVVDIADAALAGTIEAARHTPDSMTSRLPPPLPPLLLGNRVHHRDASNYSKEDVAKPEDVEIEDTHHMEGITRTKGDTDPLHARGVFQGKVPIVQTTALLNCGATHVKTQATIARTAERVVTHNNTIHTLCLKHVTHQEQYYVTTK